MKIDRRFAEETISRAIRAGADQAEIFLKSSKTLSIEIKDQSVDLLKSSLSFGYSLRVIKGGRQGFSYSTEAGDRDRVIQNALESGEYADEDKYFDLPATAPAASVAVFDPLIQGIVDRGGDDSIGMIMLIEKSAYEEDNRIKKVRKASGSFSSSETLIINSRGVDASFNSTSCSAQITAIAEEQGESQIGWDFGSSRFVNELSFETIGRNAARRAVRLLGSRKIGGCNASVILENSVTTDFLGIFAASLSSEAVQKGKSLLSGRLNSQVVSAKITMIDSGLLPGKVGSSPVDDEGVPTKEKFLVQAGVLRNYLYNTYTARRDGVVSTGNAVRGGFSSLPSVGITNLFIDASSEEYRLSGDGLLKSIEKGLLVVDAMGVHTANPISGDFSVGVTGLWIEDGKVKYPVKESVLSGNILEFFGKIESVGDDLRFYGNMGAPSLLINGVDISG